MNKILKLSETERSILRGVHEGKTYAEIASGLRLGHETIKSYATRLKAKLGIFSKVGLALYWERNFRGYNDGMDYFA